MGRLNIANYYIVIIQRNFLSVEHGICVTKTLIEYHIHFLLLDGYIYVNYYYGRRASNNAAGLFCFYLLFLFVV